VAKSYLLKIEQRTLLRHSEAPTSYFEEERANLAVFPQKNGA
jgi:hypothetical protein